MHIALLLIGLGFNSPQRITLSFNLSKDDLYNLHYVIRNQTAQNSLLTCQVIVWDSQRNPEHPRNWHQIHHSFQRVYKRFISQKVIQYLRIMVANPLSCQWLSMAPFCSLSAHLDTVWKGVKRCVDKGSNWSSWMLQLKEKLDPQNDMRLKFLWHWQLCWFIKVQQTCLKNDERLVAYFLIQNKLSLS